MNWNRNVKEKNGLMYAIILFFGIVNSYGQCSYTGTPLTQVGSANTFCIDNGNTITTPSVRAGQFVVVNVIKGFRYTFSVGNVFGGQNETLTILDGVTNANVVPATFASGASGATISNWTSSLSGQIKILLSRAACINDNTAGGALTLTLVNVGNTQDSQTEFGVDQWVGHVYNYTGGPPPGGASPTTPSSTTSPFIAANYVGYYTIASETLTESFGGTGSCFPVFSAGSARVNVFSELYAVRYRMRSTKSGCFFLNITGDDGVRVYIDGVLVVNQWQQQGPTSYCNNLIFLNGASDIVFDFYEFQGANVANFSLTPFVPSTNSIAGASVINRCSGVAPGTLDGSAYSSCTPSTIPNVLFQWQISTDNITFTNIAGATSEDYAPPAVTTTTNNVRYFRRVLRAPSSNASACEFYTNVIRVNTSATTALTISGSIAGAATQCPATANQVYSVTSVTNALNYTWTVPTGWVITSGQGTNSITVTTGTSGQNGNIAVTASNGCVTSAVKSLAVTIGPAAVGGSVSGGNSIICVNTSTGTMTLGGGFVGSVLNWEKRLNSGSWTTIANTATTYSEIPTVAGTWEYRAVVGNGTCVPVFSNTRLITVNALPTASITLNNGPICSGANATFTLSGTSGAVVTYQLNGGSNSTVTLTGGTATISVTAATASQTLQLVSISNPLTSCNQTLSGTSVVTVNIKPTTSISSNSGTICSGDNATFTLTGTAGAVVTYNLNGGASATATLTGGSATVTVSGATASQTLNLVSVTNGSCTATLSGTSTVVVGGTTTWTITSPATTPAWDNGIPTSTMTAIIAANYSENADINACTLTVNNNAVVSIPSGKNVSLNGAITVASGSSFTLNNNANLYQSNAAAVNTGNITVIRQTNPLIRLDYTLWSAPVTGQGVYAFSKTTLPNRFYVYNTSTNLYNASLGFNLTGLQYPSPLVSPNGINGTDTNNVQFTPAKGYLIRLPYNHPTAPVIWNGRFTGVPNNGTKTITLDNISATQQFNAVGNPYPSPIDISRFATDNAANIESTLYFWRKTNNNASPSYCTWNTQSGIYGDNGEAFTNNPNGVIQTGQGFLVEAKDGATSLVFNNSQREVNNANQFFKSSTASPQTTQTHAIWLNLTGASSAFSQAVVSYFDAATIGVDAYDSKYFNDGPIALNMIIEGTEYIIQGRPTFQASDVVPLNYRVTTAGSYTFTIDHVDGLFTAGAQAIYIKDNQDGSYHNLSSPYTFTSAAGTFANRFELVYQNMLPTNDNSFTANSINVIKQQNDVVVRTTGTTMQEVTIYDIRGRVLVTKSNINATETKINVGTTNQVLLVQVTTVEGAKATKKVVN